MNEESLPQELALGETEDNTFNIQVKRPEICVKGHEIKEHKALSQNDELRWVLIQTGAPNVGRGKEVISKEFTFKLRPPQNEKQPTKESVVCWERSLLSRTNSISKARGDKEVGNIKGKTELGKGPEDGAQ